MSLRSPYARNGSLFSSQRGGKPPKRKWRFGYIIKNAFKRMCMLVGFLVIFSAVMGAFTSSLFMGETKVPSIPSETILFLPLEGTFIEHSNTVGYGLGDKVPTIREVVGTIDRAAKDDRIKALVISDRGGALGLVHLQELRNAVKRFRESGKQTYFYSPSYESLGVYYLASAFEEIWLQPIGILNIPGINAEMPYARNLLDNIGIEPQIFARKEYKNLFENVTEDHMSEASREAMSSLINTLGEIISADIAEGRDLEPAAFRKALDKGLLLDEEALSAGLVDVVGYGDELNEMLIESITGDPNSDETVFTPLSAYQRAVEHESVLSPVAVKKKPNVALIYIVGQIVQHNLDGANELSSAESLVGVLRAAAERKDVKAIVIRVDSPGGSPVASESIRRAIVHAQEKGKPVIVSMGEAAASGGDWISAPADHIFAAETTFTGSIGVTGGKFSLKEMWSKLDVNWDSVSWGENSSLWSFNQPYTASERERMNALMDQIYNKFVAVVAEGRNMSPEQVDAVAGGRVWLGAQAKDVGLVDDLGGLDDALDYTANLLGHNDRQDLHVTVLPRPKTAIEKIVEFLEMQASIGKMYDINVRILEWIEPLMGAIASQENHVSALAVTPEGKI